MKYIIVYLLAILMPISGFAQCALADQLAHKALISNNLEDWAAALDAAKQLPKTADNYYTLASTAYGAATCAMVNKKDKLFGTYLDLTEEAIDELWKLDEEHAAAHGLYGAYLGLVIARSPMKGMVYGQKAAKYTRKGVEIDAGSAHANYFLGSNFFYTPDNWGGDADEALRYLRTATELMEEGDAGCNWLDLQTLALYGQAQAKTGDKEGARLTYLRALKNAPDFGYVQYDLLPRLDRGGK